MKLGKIVIAIAAAVAAGVPAVANVTAEEARQLGTTLTEFGAIRAASADGRIPAYTGGFRGTPAGFQPDSGFWVDPFAADRPLYRITASNMAQHAHRLSAGQEALLRANPTTYYMDIYPSRRSVAFPEFFLRNTVRNATTCRIGPDNLSLQGECAGGLPFPIPKTGYEVMWNHLLTFRAGLNMVTTSANRSWVIDTQGRRTMTAEQRTWTEMPFYQVNLPDRDHTVKLRVHSFTTAPARMAGAMTGFADSIDQVGVGRRAWTYTPGQRRIRLAPEFAYDTPVASQGGVTLFDELFVFSGKMDRFTFRLVGQAEMYLPYNSYRSKFFCPPEQSMMARHANPECERWELHRVWVVEATLRPGMRHVYAKRRYYFDADQTGAALYDAWDHSGVLYRSIFNGWTQLYDKTLPQATRTVIYDFNRGNWAYINDVSVGGFRVVPPLPNRQMVPEAIVARETQR